MIDPLFAYTGKSDAHRDAEMRGALAPLISLCESLGVALLVLRHLNKNAGGGPAMYRGGGTIGIIGAARCAFVASRHPDDDARCVLAPVKMNLCEQPAALAYHLERYDLAVSGTVGVMMTSRVIWDGPVEVSADDLVARKEPGEASSALQDAIDFLREELKGGPIASVELERLARQHGHSVRTLKRGRSALGVIAYKDRATKEPRWMSKLPDLSVAVGSAAEGSAPAPVAAALALV